MKNELILNIIMMMAALGSNNWLSTVVSMILCAYNTYAHLNKENLLCLINNCQKDNRSDGNKVGIIFKIKFFVYTIMSMYALSFTVINYVEDMDDIRDMFNIIKSSYE